MYAEVDVRKTKKKYLYAVFSLFVLPLLRLIYMQKYRAPLCWANSKNVCVYAICNNIDFSLRKQRNVVDPLFCSFRTLVLLSRLYGQSARTKNMHNKSFCQLQKELQTKKSCITQRTAAKNRKQAVSQFRCIFIKSTTYISTHATKTVPFLCFKLNFPCTSWKHKKTIGSAIGKFPYRRAKIAQPHIFNYWRFYNLPVFWMRSRNRTELTYHATKH